MERLRLGRGPALVIALGATALAIPTLLAGPAAAGKDASEKLPMTRVTEIECDGDTPPGKASDSFATITVTGDIEPKSVDGDGVDATVVAKVSIRDAAPNKQYEVLLTQTRPKGSCGGFDRPVTTDDKGNADITLSTKYVKGRTGAFVAADGPGPILISPTVVWARDAK